jgi:hypothetical protein
LSIARRNSSKVTATIDRRTIRRDDLAGIPTNFIFETVFVFTVLRGIHAAQHRINKGHLQALRSMLTAFRACFVPNDVIRYAASTLRSL